LNETSSSDSNILVVDADHRSRQETCGYLRDLGFQPLEAHDAATAKTLAQTRQPQVALISYDLRDEEGTELCAQLKAQPQTTLIPIMMTVPNAQQIIDLAYQVGAEDVLVQPFTADMLRRRLSLLLRLSTQTRRAAASEKRAHQMFHENRAVMLMIDPLSGRIVDANRAACSFYGYRQDAFTQMVLADLDAPASHEPEFALKTTNLVMRHQLANGEIRDITMFSGPVEVDGRKQVCMIIYDVTKRKIAEANEQTQRSLAEQLERERAQLRAILDAMHEGVMYGEVMQQEAEQIHIRYTNRALEALTGFSQTEWLQQGLVLMRDADTPSEQYERMFDEARLHLNKRGTWMTEIQLPRKDGSSFAASFSVIQLRAGDGKTFGVVGVIRDISREKALADQKSQFVAYASHELRTPLTNAKTRLYLVRKQPERAGAHLDVLENVIDRMRRLVDLLLDLSRLERGKTVMHFKDADLRSLIREIYEGQLPEAEQKNLRLLCDTPTHEVIAQVDPEQFTQVVINLLSNAINYTREGSVTLRLHVTDGDNGSGPYALIDIEDTGVGISEEDMRNIFQPFYRVTSDVQGTGLGLSIAKEIVVQHGGTIAVRSVPGQGSTFSVMLPISVQSAALTEATP
jgi:PAS domain S-box-containing protein